MKSHQFGRWAETYAKDFLISKGLRLIEQNYRSRFGEIDLIMQDARLLIFIEVRARFSTMYGDGAMSVTRAKQEKIIRTAALYIQHVNMHNKATVRFDVVSIDGKTQALTWIKNAFY
jgi:putative endonuclease